MNMTDLQTKPDAEFSGPKSRTLLEKMKQNRIAVISVAAALIIVMLLAVVYVAGAKAADKDRVMDKFEKAVLKNDTGSAVRLLHSSDPSLINDQTAAAWIDFLNKNPDYLTKIKNVLQNVDEASPVRLIKDGKTMLVFNRYLLDVSPHYIQASSNLPETKIYVDGTEAGAVSKEGEKKQFGPYLPGVHTVKGVFQGDYASIEDSREVDLFDAGGQSDVAFSLKANYVTLSSNYDDADVYVNGKKIGSVKENGKIGPVSLDGSVKIMVEKEFPWGKAKSAETAITSASNLMLPVQTLTDELKEQAMELINEYRQSWFEARTERDVSLIKNAGEARLAELKKEIDAMFPINNYFQGHLVRMQFDLDSFALDFDKDVYSIRVNAREDWKYANYASKKGRNPDFEQRSFTYYRLYRLDFTDGNWLIYDQEGKELSFGTIRNFEF